jgi:hypothetical protein
VTCSQRTPRQHDSDTGDKWASDRGCTSTAEHTCDCRIAARLTAQVCSVSHANGAHTTVSSQSFDVHPRYCGRLKLSCLCATPKSATITTSTRSSTTLLSITTCQTPITEQYTSRAISVAIPRSKAQNDLCGPGSAGSNVHVLSGVPESAEFTAWLVYAMTLWPLALLLVRSGGRHKAAKLSFAVIILCTSPIGPCLALPPMVT